jgi:hypothetical protein
MSKGEPKPTKESRSQENEKKEAVRKEVEVVAFFENLFLRDETIERIANALGNSKSAKTKKTQAEGFYRSLIGMIAKDKKLLEIDEEQLEFCIRSAVEKNLDSAFSGDGKKSKISGKNEQRNIRKIFSKAEKEPEAPVDPDNAPRNLGAAAKNEGDAETVKEEMADFKESIKDLGSLIMKEHTEAIKKAWESGALESLENYLIKEADFSDTDKYDEKELKNFINDKNAILKSLYNVYSTSGNGQEKSDDTDGPINSEGKQPNVFEGKTVLNFISDKVRRDWEKEVSEKEALERQVEAESAANDAAEQLRKFAGNSGNMSAGAAGAAAKSGVFGENKVEEEKTEKSEESSQSQEPTGDEKEKSDPNEPAVAENETNGEEKKKTRRNNKKEKEEKTFNESLERSREKQFSTLSRIESGELDVSYFSGLAHYLSEIKAYYEKEKSNIETLSEPNRKRAEAEYEKTSKEIESRWEEVRDAIVSRVKGYIDEQVERNLKRLESDKANGKINDELKEYTLLKDLIVHAIPKETSSKEEIEKYLEKRRKDIHQAFKEAKKNKTGAESAESSEGEKSEDEKKEEKEKLELPEKIMDAFRGVVQRTRGFYLKELGGDDGYLSGLSKEDSEQLLRLLVKKVLNEKIEEKEGILVEKFGFSADQKDVLANKILDSIL